MAVVQTVVKRFLKQQRSLRNLPLLQVAEGTFGAILISCYFPHHHCLDHRQKFKDYPIGYLHVDFAEVQTEEGKQYLPNA